MAEGDLDTSRAAVRTYVPAYQKDEWQRHADQLDMSLSEFVRTMVQAGRRGFDPDLSSEAAPAPSADGAEKPTTGGDGLDERVVEALEESGPLSWDELLSAVTGDIESNLEETLAELQSANRVTHSGRAGGYVLEDT